MDVVTIRDETIRLGQLLKLHGVAEHGAMAKDLIAAGDVRVNGEVETRRGATIRPGDRVEALGEAFEVESESAGEA
ncbi:MULTISPECIES: RNA-binding S4 domain-containing protein [Brevibacterium]|jgi:ribosome-associated protein|uniref:RNA-binding S4 domain-containing protein n=1 Tax=Brevibacterium casei TaxID=33889 RepID=A0A7T4DIF6_9MICO|nr:MULTISPECIES: RNA-binding S4 domain-containing protein [Brevibacterium]QQB14512.1 RNA-binding S4 domain-containing protein [Brevibacterium casei]